MNTISFPKMGISFKIDPIALHYSGGGGIYWYGIIIAAGILLAILYCSHISQRENMQKDAIADLAICAIPFSVICARLYYVAFSWDSYKSTPADIIKIWEGGLAIYGGITGAVISAFVFCKIKKINVLQAFDICCLGLLIGQSIGRWGNFVNCEAHGGKCTYFWGMSINGDKPVHPTFLYESLWNALGFLILSKLNKKRSFNGFTFFLYLVWYGTGRFFIEGMRTDSLYLGSFRVSQLVALGCVVIGAASFAVLLRKNIKNKCS